MKKGIVLLLAVLMLFTLAACGVPQEKKDALTAKYDELIGLVDQFDGMIADLETLVEETGTSLGAFLGPYKTQMAKARAGYATQMNRIDEMSSADIDEGMKVMQADIDEITPIITMFEDLMPDMKGYLETSVAAGEDGATIQAMASSMETTPSQELTDMYDAYLQSATSLQSDVMALMNGIDESDLSTLVTAFEQANAYMNEFYTQGQELIAQMELEGAVRPDAA